MAAGITWGRSSRVAAIGPEVGYAFTAGGLQWYANLRGYSEFWAENRLQGYAIFATRSIPLGSGPKKTQTTAAGVGEPAHAGGSTPAEKW